MTETDLEMFMAKLKRLLYDNFYTLPIGNNPYIEARKPEIQLLYEELVYLTGSCFKDNTIDEQQLHDVGNRKIKLIQVAQEAEDIVDMFLSSAIIKNHFSWLYEGSMSTHRSLRQIRGSLDCSLKDLKGVVDNLKSIRDEISNKKGNLFQNLIKQDMMMDTRFEATGTTVNLSTTEHEEFIVGFDDDVLLILDRLTGYPKRLDLISIVGMGGLGKTTLATKLFNDSLVRYHFDMRGWITVSQKYSKRDLLVQLLASIGKRVPEAAGESELCEMLYQSLKGRKYLIVIDDVWSRKAWDDVGLCFPDDNTGSRVLVTTRLTEVALHASRGGFTHNIGHLTEDQSWELLCRKTFTGYECPDSLIETGKHIAKKCGGLPLALVVIAGLLEKEEKTKDLWEKIVESVGSYIISDPKGCMDTRALSYDHLPSHLKKCFMYVGGFPEDYNIQVQRLIRLWMAEGFIKETAQRSLEEEGEYYLMDLINRNLLIVADKRSNGGIKSCRLHDLLRQLCLKKASEENFFTITSMPMSNNNLFSKSVSHIVKQRRLFTDKGRELYLPDSRRHTRSLLCFGEGRPGYHSPTSWVGSFLLLRVLDLQHTPVDFSNINLLLHLRYVAVWSRGDDFSSSKANGWSLQTLIVKGMLYSFIYSPYIMANLRHLRCGRIDIPFHYIDSTLFNLQTISRLMLDHRTPFLLKPFPSIKKLGCFISSTLSNHGLLSFEMLTPLEALDIDAYMHKSLTLTNPIRFPETLRKLTLKGLYLPWNYMSTIQRLPKLEVLKLLDSSFMGRLWETGDEQFQQLKYLKLRC